MPVFPTVPLMPGVPPLLRDPAALINTGGSIIPGLPIELLGHSGNFFLDNVYMIADSQGLFGAIEKKPQWGIFKSGVPVVVADNVLAIEFTQNWELSDFPLEKGAFESYNKVATPFAATVRFSAGGSQQNRQALLDSIDAIAGDLELYDIHTPEVTYPSINITRFDYQRTSRDGVGLLVVDVRVQEVRTTATAEFTNTKNAAGASPVNVGNLNARPLTQDEINKVVSDVGKLQIPISG